MYTCSYDHFFAWQQPMEDKICTKCTKERLHLAPALPKTPNVMVTGLMIYVHAF